ncbi:MAG: AraC family transcriptional regulator [Firmicutes bacterium]|nr:AraC family transcriptional regulator [Bacillota bacterium]
MSVHNYGRTDSENFDKFGSNMKRGVIDSDFELHTHDFYEASIVVSGSAKHVIGDYSYTLKRGDIYVIKKEIAHGFYDVENLDVIDLMYFPELFISADIQLFNLPGFRSLFIIEPNMRVNNYYPYVLTLTENDLNYVVETANFIMQELMKKDNDNIILVKHFMLSIFAYLSVKYTVSFDEPQATQILTRAVNYMHENLARQIKVSDIASHSFVSTRHLNRLFIKYYNITPSQHLLDIRLKKANVLLSKNKMTIKEISEHCGFTDPSYFTRLYKKNYGVTPNKA